MSDTLAETKADTQEFSREMLLKEVRYRASYRGTLELDMVCRPMIEHLDTLDTAELTAVRDLLLNKEGDLMSWLVDGRDAPEEWRLTVALVRHFFKLSRADADAAGVRVNV